MDRTEAADRLGPGDTIVLYTDGLVERPSVGISARLDLLVDSVRDLADAEPARLLDGILETLLDEEHRQDDVCVLALQRLPSPVPFTHSFPAASGEVARLRRAFADWLDGWDVDPERRFDAVLALSEAAANAAEHAYGFDGEGIIEVEADVFDGELRLSIRDRGRWREPDPTSDRGRGRTIMDALAREVTIEPAEVGTVVRLAIPTRAEVPA
jgi:anti-sigma regulatory factor (Ser/Thr protein kinase)